MEHLSFQALLLDKYKVFLSFREEALLAFLQKALGIFHRFPNVKQYVASRDYSKKDYSIHIHLFACPTGFVQTERSYSALFVLAQYTVLQFPELHPNILQLSSHLFFQMYSHSSLLNIHEALVHFPLFFHLESFLSDQWHPYEIQQFQAPASNSSFDKFLFWVSRFPSSSLVVFYCKSVNSTHSFLLNTPMHFLQN